MGVGILLHSLLNAAVHGVHIGGLLQSEQDTVKVVRSPCSCPVAPVHGSHGQQQVVGHDGVAGHVGINAADGDVEQLLHGKYLADGAFITIKLTGFAFGDEGVAHQVQVVRVALKQCQAGGGEVGRVGKEGLDVFQFLVVLIEGGLPESGGQASALHQFGEGLAEVGRVGAVGTVVVFGFGHSLGRVPHAQHDECVRVRIEAVEAQLIGYLCEEQYAHYQSQRK